jgi:beta-lactamase class C
VYLLPLFLGMLTFASNILAQTNENEWVENYVNSVAAQAKKFNIPGFAIVVVKKGQPAQFKY